MELSDKIIITGGAGFIGARLAGFLLKNGHLAPSIQVVDDSDSFNNRQCTSALREAGLSCLDIFALPDLLNSSRAPRARAVFHLGAISNTEERDELKLRRYNVEYSKALWNYCVQQDVPFYYASSASTYGNGDKGFDDDPTLIASLEPLNLYASSKQKFDLFVLEQIAVGKYPTQWAGFKFFNVYGPGEDHKAGQKSVLWKAKEQFTAHGLVKLFKSHHPNYPDGQQSRDFVFVDDVCRVLNAFYDQHLHPGIYNLGSGQARSFNDLIRAVAKEVGVPANIEYIPTPENLRNQYQYFTEATLQNLRQAGYTAPMTPLEEGVHATLSV